MSAETPATQEARNLPIVQAEAPQSAAQEQPEEINLLKTAKAILEGIKSLGMAVDARNPKHRGEINVPMGMIGSSVRSFLEKPPVGEDGSVPITTPFDEHINKIIDRMEREVAAQGADLVGIPNVNQILKELRFNILAVDDNEPDEGSSGDLAVKALEGIEGDQFDRISEADLMAVVQMIKHMYPIAAAIYLEELAEPVRQAIAAKEAAKKK